MINEGQLLVFEEDVAILPQLLQCTRFSEGECRKLDTFLGVGSIFVATEADRIPARIQPETVLC